MWLRLLFDTNATLQGDGDAFCIAGVAFFRGVMHLGRSVMQWGEACFTWGSDAFIVHEMGQGSVASGVHEMGTLVHLVSMISCSRPLRRGCR